jgi:putative restriction endonuclease
MVKRTNKSPVTAESFLKRLDEIGVFASGGKRAVHKPLLILLALARFQQGSHALFSFEEIEGALTGLIRQFGTTSNSHKPRADYPFWYLKNDGFWELANTDGLRFRRGKPEPKPASLIENRTLGGFCAPVRQLLAQKPQIIEQAAARLLGRCFPETIRGDIEDAIGLQVSQIQIATKRDARFRQNVLRAYGYACAICGFDGRVDGRLVGVEAAHIKWVEAGGPNDIPNGIAMCALHHKLFDTGAFTVVPDAWSIDISNLLSGNSPLVRQLVGRNGKRIQLPVDKSASPSTTFLSWHKVEVFREI